jgi:uncharacterized protein YjdB
LKKFKQYLSTFLSFIFLLSFLAVSPEQDVHAASNLAAGKVPTASSSSFKDLSLATDGIKSSSNYADGYPDKGIQWIQMDLGTSQDINNIKLWHYFGDSRKYHDVIVQLSADSTFSTGVITTVFNNDTDNSAGLGLGKDSEYTETSSGLNITFNTVNARYVRFYSNGSTANDWNHYDEIEIYGGQTTTNNLAAWKSLTSSTNFTGISRITDSNLDTDSYADGYPNQGLQWVQIDLGASQDVNNIKLLHYFGDARKYHDVIVQLSNDSTFSTGVVTTVFNNDTDGSAGLGLGLGKDSEYAETSTGLNITFNTVNARYARFYSSGSTANNWNHYVEIEIYGSSSAIHATAVNLNKTTDSIAIGATDKLTPTFTPAETTNKNVTWVSSDATIASVSPDGTVTGVKAGTATITVKTEDGGFTKDCVVTVTAPTVHPTSVVLNKTTDSIVIGATDKLTATFTPAETTNKNVTWSSSDATIASVATDGTVTGVKAGTAKITVKTEDGALTAICDVTVTAPASGNIAAGKTTTASSTAFKNLSQATDGIKGPDNYADSATASGLQWIQVDLGSSYNVSYIELWHYYGTLRQYKDVIVQLSNDPTFTNGVTTVYNNDTNNSAKLGTGTNSEYAETGAGLNIAFNSVNARYARFYSSGSNINAYNHYSEVEIYTAAPSTVATGNLVAGKSLTTSTTFTNLAKANDGIKTTENYADASTGLQWLQADLGASYDVSYIKLYHYFSGSRKYHDVIVQLSDDPEFKTGVTTVYNNDKDNSAKLGTGAYNEYTENGLGLEITIASKKARYIRCYSNGNTVNTYNHYVELEAYEEAPASQPLSNAPEYLDIPTYEGSGQCTHPGVVYFANGWNGYKYWMTYTPYPNSQDMYENPSICASNDGINWVTPNGLDNPLADRPAVGHNCDGELIYNSKKNQLMMYWVETDDATINWVKLVTSTNGVDWTSPKAVITDTRDCYSILSPTIDYNADAGVYYMWSMNASPDDSAAGQQYFIERRQSTDGLTWTSPTKIQNFGQINTEIWHLSIRYIPSVKEYWAFVAAYPEGNVQAATEEYFLKSTDGLNWTSYPNKTVLPTNSGWDSFRIYRSSFVYDPETDIIKVWYSASDADAGFWGIGYTTNTYTNMMYNLLY